MEGRVCGLDCAGAVSDASWLVKAGGEGMDGWWCCARQAAFLNNSWQRGGSVYTVLRFSMEKERKLSILRQRREPPQHSPATPPSPYTNPPKKPLKGP